MYGLFRTPTRWLTGWDLWSLPTRLRTYVLVVMGFAGAVTAGTAFLLPVTHTDLIRFGILAGLAALAIETTRRIEREREALREGATPYFDTKSVWSFAAALVLPPALASAMVVWTYLFAWWRIWPIARPMRPFRWVFSAATVLCASQGVVAVLSLGMSHYPGIPATSLTGLRDVAVVCAAGVLRWAVNGALVYLVLILSRPNAKLSDMFDDVSLHLIEAGAMALGVIAAVLVIDNPWVLVFVAMVVFVMHCGVLLTQLRRETRLDSKTGLFNASGWHSLAEKALLAARERKGTLGVLMIDIDHFKRINDSHGHLAGDRVLRAVADELRATTRDIDRCGRFGGEEFTIFIPDVATAQNLARMAERIRLGIDALTVADIPGRDDVTLAVTVSIGGAVYRPGEPGPQTVDDLVRTADVALYAAKNGAAGNGGRNQVHIAEAAAPGAPAEHRERPATQADTQH